MEECYKINISPSEHTGKCLLTPTLKPGRFPRKSLAKNRPLLNEVLELVKKFNINLQKWCILKIRTEVRLGVSVWAVWLWAFNLWNVLGQPRIIALCWVASFLLFLEQSVENIKIFFFFLGIFVFISPPGKFFLKQLMVCFRGFQEIPICKGLGSTNQLVW